MSMETKRCHFCGEEILAIAIKCKYCQSMLHPSSGGAGYTEEILTETDANLLPEGDISSRRQMGRLKVTNRRVVFNTIAEWRMIVGEGSQTFAVNTETEIFLNDIAEIENHDRNFKPLGVMPGYGLFIRTSAGVKYYFNVINPHPRSIIEKMKPFLSEMATAHLNRVEEAESLCKSISMNPNLSAEDLGIHSRNSEVSVRLAVAEHPKTPPEVLEILARDMFNKYGTGYVPSYPVRVAVAANRNTPPDVLRLLANRKDHMSRIEITEALVKNPNTPPEVLSQLRKDPDDYVRQAAGGKKSCFIATAVYGSETAPEVMLLRDFRDRILMQHRLGKWFAATYYVVSPPLAGLIKRTWVLKSVVKWCILSPLLRVIINRFSPD